MPLQNRVDPAGELFRTPARGTMMGNRGGVLHNSEREIVRAPGQAAAAEIPAELDASDLLHLQDAAARVMVDDAVVDYLLAIVEETRRHESLALGVSPRGSQALYRAAQAMALAEGRDYAVPDDVKQLAVPVFAHRVVVNGGYASTLKKSEQADQVLREIVENVAVPV